MIPDAATKLSRRFLVGFFAPSSLAVLAGCLASVAGRFSAAPWKVSEGEFEAVVTAAAATLFLTTLALAVLLQALNIHLIKIFEGLWPPLLGLRERLRQRWLVRLREQFRAISALMESRDDDEVDDAYEMERLLLSSIPSNEDDVLATRLGNVIAAWEQYPYRRYGMDAITLWPLLAPILPAPIVDAISLARTRFDYFLNLAALSIAMALLWPFLWARGPASVGTYAGSVGYLAAALLLYRSAVRAAQWWGDTVKAAFDLHRLRLLKALHIVVPPRMGPEDERAIWREIQWSKKFDYTPSLVVTTAPATGTHAGDERVEERP